MHLQDIHSFFEETLQRWQAVNNVVLYLTGQESNPCRPPINPSMKQPDSEIKLILHISKLTGAFNFLRPFSCVETSNPALWWPVPLFASQCQVNTKKRKSISLRRISTTNRKCSSESNFSRNFATKSYF